MGEERKPHASDAEPPIPRAAKDDVEDVSWALSTAEAMWGRGDRADALKWVRRAAEAASQAEQDERALELAKAAADLATLVERSASMPPPQPIAGVPRSIPPFSPLPPPAPSSTSAVSPSRAPAAVRPLPPAPPSVPRSSSLPAAPAPTHRSPSDRARRRRSSKPPREEVAPPAPPTVPADMDAWPTQSMGAEELSGLNEERTRIGTPAYREAAKTSSAAPVNLVPPSHPSQAMRVVVWRGADGVHVAPHGSTVSAITIEAFLVAVDPGADLAAWFSRK